MHVMMAEQQFACSQVEHAVQPAQAMASGDRVQLAPLLPLLLPVVPQMGDPLLPVPLLDVPLEEPLLPEVLPLPLPLPLEEPLVLPDVLPLLVVEEEPLDDPLLLPEVLPLLPLVLEVPPLELPLLPPEVLPLVLVPPASGVAPASEEAAPVVAP